MDRLGRREGRQHHLHFGRLEDAAVVPHVAVVHLDVGLGEEAEDLRQQMALAVGELVAPVLDVVGQRHFLGQPVDALLHQPGIVGPGIVERLVDRLGVEQRHEKPAIKYELNERNPVAPQCGPAARRGRLRLLTAKTLFVVGRLLRCRRRDRAAPVRERVDSWGAERAWSPSGAAVSASPATVSARWMRERAAVVEALHAALPGHHVDLVQVALVHVGRQEDVERLALADEGRAVGARARPASAGRSRTRS